MYQPITLKTNQGEVTIEADAFMICQREFDINQNHIETGDFWDFLNEHFEYALAGRTAYAVDKNSAGYAYLLEKQKEWRYQKEVKRKKDREWRNSLNKKIFVSRRLRFFRAG